MIKDLVSIVLPSRNEPYLHNTIKSLLKNAKGEIEIIAILDGWWESPEKIIFDPRVNYVHFTEPRGMRAGINAGVAISRGEFIMKLDAHCLVGEGYDIALRESCGENWVVVPRRYALDVENWKREERTDSKYPLDYQFLSCDLHGEVWKEMDNDPEKQKMMIDETMSSQGSCWFMRRTYFDFLELMDEETYGTFWSEFQEIGMKAWLSGGKCVVNKTTWYAHWHKPKSHGRGYSLPKGEKERTEAMVANWRKPDFWHKQTRTLDWLVDHFKPVPTWK